MRYPSDQALTHLVWITNGQLSKSLDAATWLETTRELRKYWQVTLITMDSPSSSPLQGVDLLCFHSPNIYFLRMLIFHIKVLFWLVRSWGTFHIILLHQMSLLWLMPLLIARNIIQKSAPLFVMDTRTIPMENRENANTKDRLRANFHILMQHVGNHWADGQTAITYRMAEYVQIRPKKLWGVWPSGVSLEKFAPAKNLRRWPSGKEPIHLIYVGVLNYERNLMTLCRAVEQANNENTKFKLTLIGDGTQRRELEEFACKTKSRIQVLAPVQHEKVPDLLSSAHVGVLPFPDQEKFRVSSPIKLLEYMGSGMPILATRIFCHTDVIGEENFAFWANNSNVDGIRAALQEIWVKKDCLCDMGIAAFNASHAWTWRESALKLKSAMEHGLEMQ